MLDLESYADASARVPAPFTPYVVLAGIMVFACSLFASMFLLRSDEDGSLHPADRRILEAVVLGLALMVGGVFFGWVLGTPPEGARGFNQVVEASYGIEDLRYGKDDPMRGVVSWSASPLPPEGEYKALWASGSDGGEELVHGTLTLLDDKVQLQTDKGKILKPVKAYSIPGRPEE